MLLEFETEYENIIYEGLKHIEEDTFDTIGESSGPGLVETTLGHVEEG